MVAPRTTSCWHRSTTLCSPRHATDDQITSKLHALLGPDGNEEIVSELLEQDYAAVAEAALRLLLSPAQLDAVADGRVPPARCCAISGDVWVVDGNYSAVRDLIWERADTVVWLDLPGRVVMRQVAARTLRRMVSVEELWNRNRERWRTLFGADSSIIVWAWTQHDKYRQRYAAAAKSLEFGHLVFIRLGSKADVDRFLRSL